MLQYQLFVKAENCEFHQKMVFVLDFVLSPSQIRMVNALVNWMTAMYRKQLLHFLGIANFYRRFIQNYSQNVAPLHVLISWDSKVSWSLEAEAAFQSLHTRFSLAPIMQMSRPGP